MTISKIIEIRLEDEEIQNIKTMIKWSEKQIARLKAEHLEDTYLMLNLCKVRDALLMIDDTYETSI